MRYFYSSEEDKILFSKILKQNISLLVGVNSNLTDHLVDEFFRKLDYLNIYDWHTKNGTLKKGVHGETKFSTNGHTGINMYGNNGYTGDISYISKLFSHEIWHALITVLNRIYGSAGVVNLKVKNQEVMVRNYSGFFICRSGNSEFMLGYLLVEVMADILSHIVYELDRDKQYNIDDAFNYKIEDNTLDAPYDDFLTLVQLFIAAFSLDSKFSYGSNSRNGKGLMGYYINLNKKRNIANEFIEGTLINPLSIMNEYDRYMGIGEYLNLLWDLDLLYSDYVKSLKMNVDMLKSIGDRLSSFVNKRLGDYLSKEYIDEEAYNILVNNYNELLEVFKEEISNYEVKTGTKILKKIFNKIRR